MDAAKTITEAPHLESESRGMGLSEPTLLDPDTQLRDARLVSRAIKERWRIPEGRKDHLVKRLFDIVEKTSIDVMTRFGPEAMDGPADVNAIAAARVIVQMEGQNQTDEKPETTNPTVNVGVAINGVTAKEIAAELVLSGDWRKLERQS